MSSRIHSPRGSAWLPGKGNLREGGVTGLAGTHGRVQRLGIVRSRYGNRETGAIIQHQHAENYWSDHYGEITGSEAAKFHKEEGVFGPIFQAGLNTCRYLLVFEVLSFSCFLFSSLIAHGIKLYIVLGNVADAENIKSAYINNRLLRSGILLAAMGSAAGSVFLTFSLVNIVQIKLGSFNCGSVWTQRTTIPLVGLVSTGGAIFTSALLPAFRT